MRDKGIDKKFSTFTLFPVKQQNGSVIYYVSDFSEELGSSVYKGYACTLLQNDPIDLKPRRVKKEELNIDEKKPVSIKLYEFKQHPSPYQFYASEKAVLNIEDRDVLIMDFIDGVHIYPKTSDNPELNQLPFLQAVEVCWQLVIGLNHLHYNNSHGPPIVHGDIHGENVKIKINVPEETGGNKYEIKVSYLDLDYAKRILQIPQRVQGTPEHIALEVLQGEYSESSDFFALSPLLLSIFGAHNPFERILEFRNKHPKMKSKELIKSFREIRFCSEGLFEHFEKKPNPFICNLIKNFILQMGEKNKKDRPLPHAILEFFTALRQFMLFNEYDAFAPDKDLYFMRLCISAQEKHCFREKKYQTLFFNLEERLQNRLIALMSPNQCVVLYKIAQEKQAPDSLLNEFRKNIVIYLTEQIQTLKMPIWPGSFFFPSITSHDIKWLLSCYEENNTQLFYSTDHEKTRKKLERCTEKKLAPLISMIKEGISEQIDPPPSVAISSTN